MTTETLADFFTAGKADVPEDNALTAAAHEYLAARTAKEAVEESLKTASARQQNAEDLLLRLMAAAGVKSLRLDDGAGSDVLISEATSTYYSAASGMLDDGAFYAWLLRAGGHDLVKRTIHHASFSSFCRELVEAGRAIHPAVKVATKKQVRMKR